MLKDMLMRFTSSHTLIAATLMVCGLMAARPLMAAIEPLAEADCRLMTERNTITEKNPLPCRRLARVTFSYVDFEGVRHNDGKIVVMDAVAPYVQEIFATLLQRGFPLKKAVPLEHYKGDDKASMDDNNTNSFNGRALTGRPGWSLHAYGAAIDINPMQNPYVSFTRDEHGAYTGQAKVEPLAATAVALNRLNVRPNEPVYPGRTEGIIDIFASNGFLMWGGYWDTPLDYHHFQIGRASFVEYLARVSPAVAAGAVTTYVQAYRSCMLQRPMEREHDTRRATCVRQVVEASPQ